MVQRASGPGTLGTKGLVITPNPSADNVPAEAKGIVALTTGNVTIIPVDNADGETLAFVGIAAGWVPPFIVRRVTAATATVAAIAG